MAHRYNFEEIEQYLDGNLEGEALAEFEQSLSEDEALGAELKEHRQLRKLVHLQARNVLKDKVKNIQSSINQEGEVGEAKASKNFSMLRIAASIALLMVVGISYFYIANTYSSSQLAQDAFSTYPNRHRLMGQQNATAFSNAMNAYDTEKYSEAIPYFETIDAGDSLYLSSRLYMGISYLIIEQYQNAIPVLQEVEQNHDAAIAEVGRWYLSLAYIQNGQEEEARQMLNQIISENAYQAGQATELLEKLDSPMRKIPGVN